MAFWSDIPSRIALAFVCIAVLFAFVPSKAAAHGVHPSQIAHVDSTGDTTSAHAQKRAVEVSALQVPLKADHPGHSDCSDRGCCANGHCGSFCGIIAPALLSVFGTATASVELNRNASPLVGLATDGPARPPKPFA